MPTHALNWEEALTLPLVRRLADLIERGFGSRPGFAGAAGEWIAGPERSHACAEAAALAAPAATAAAPYRCPAHDGDGWTELCAPVRAGGSYRGCIFTRVRPGADLDVARDLLELCADEMASTVNPSAAPAPPAPDERTYEGIIGRSPSMQAMFRMLDKVADSESTVLIQGENGTGKELVARAIHYNSRRARERFVVQNCSAFNDNLLDSELFGHKRGSFTGAIADKPGLFEIADRGTFFLDEVGDMSPQLQVKLLRVLQEGTFLPVGDTTTRRTDVRIIAATNRDLKKMVERGEFREDLYYRINVINVTLPPLRERRDDIPMLVEHFLRKNARSRRTRPKRVSRGCLERLLAYAWPGNIRELENEIERVVVLSGDEPVINEELLSPRLQKAAAPTPEAAEGEADSLNAAVDAVERNIIYEALKKAHWNKTKAAQQLRISRRNLIRKVDKYKLDRGRAR